MTSVQRWRLPGGISAVEWLVLAAVACIPLRWSLGLDSWVAAARVSDALAVLATAAWVLSGRVGPACRRSRRLWISVLVWWLAGVAAVVFAETASATQAAKVLGYAVVGCSALLVADVGAAAESRRRLAISFVLGVTVSCVAAAAGVVLFYAGIETPFLNHRGDLLAGNYPRVRGLSVGTNGFAELVCLGVVLVSGVPREMPRLLRRVLGAAALVAVPFTFSRGILSLALAWLGLRSRPIEAEDGPRRALGLAPVIAVGLASVAAVLVIARWWILWRPTAPLTFSVAEQAGTKWQIWEATLETIGKSPIIGSGFAPPAWGGMQAHNLLLGTWAERGIVGVAAIVALVGSALAVAWRHAERDPWSWALFWLLVVLSFDGLFLDVHSQRHFWMVLGLVEATRIIHVAPVGARSDA